MRNKKPFYFGIRLLLAFVLGLSGCSNALESAANKTSDEARYQAALIYVNKQQYTEAVVQFDLLSAGFGARRAVRQAWAGALAGKCGFNFINYFTFMGAAPSGTFFQYLMSPWVGVSVDPTSCKKAEQKIKDIWASETPTASEQLFMMVLSLAKMGAYLRYRADNGAAGSTNGDGTVDVEFDACNAATSSDLISDSEVKEVVTGLSLFLQNSAGFLANLGGGLDTMTTSINTACGSMVPNPCATTESSGVTAPMVTSMRKILSTAAATTIGIGSCVPMDLAMSNCCP